MFNFSLLNGYQQLKYKIYVPGTNQHVFLTVRVPIECCGDDDDDDDDDDEDEDDSYCLIKLACTPAVTLT